MTDNSQALLRAASEAAWFMRRHGGDEFATALESALTRPSSPTVSVDTVERPWVVTAERGGANSHVFDDRIEVDGNLIAFSDEPWTSHIVTALALTQGRTSLSAPRGDGGAVAALRWIAHVASHARTDAADLCDMMERKAKDTLAAITLPSSSVEGLREALEPFADRATFYCDDPETEVRCATATGMLVLRVAHFRAAFAALSASSPVQSTEVQGLIERGREAIERLAHTNMDMSLRDWSDDCATPLLAALDALQRLTSQPSSTGSEL